MLKKRNFAVILTQDIRWVVKRLKFVSYCMINCGETGNDIFPKILVFEWLQVDVIFEADGCIKLISPPPSSTPPNCWVSYRWPVGCIKREENDMNIAKPSIHKAAVSGINEMIFPSFSWTYLLFIIHQSGLDK